MAASCKAVETPAGICPVQAMRLLQQLFGVSFVYRVNEVAEGYGPANTRGIDAASGEFIFLINNDL